MHYCINVFVTPGDSLRGALAPFCEDLSVDDPRAAWKNSSKWDYWVNGGRYDGYWKTETGEGRNVASVKDILRGALTPRFEVPYAFVTLSRNERYPNVSRGWFEREIYIPGGFYNTWKRPKWAGGDGETEEFRLDHFIDAPHYNQHYQDYLREVPEDTLVYVVDIHK
jgi:hypothetical protein